MASEDVFFCHLNMFQKLELFMLSFNFVYWRVISLLICNIYKQFFPHTNNIIKWRKRGPDKGDWIVLVISDAVIRRRMEVASPCFVPVSANIRISWSTEFGLCHLYSDWVSTDDYYVICYLIEWVPPNLKVQASS